MTNNIRLDEGKIQRSRFSEGPKTEKPKIIPKGQSTIKNETMNIDFNTLSYEEINQLEKELKRHKASRKDMRCYRVTFTVGFIANKHLKDVLDDPEKFGHSFMVYLSNRFREYYGLQSPEGVSSGDVVELKPEEFPEMFKPE